MSWRGPALETLLQTNPRETSFMRHFRAVATPAESGASRRDGLSWTPLEDIAPPLVAAAVKSEDPHFFTHRGVDWPETRRKAWLALRGRFAGGASTITQQLARNLYLTPSRSLTRKLRELRLAVRIDRALPKTRILELYLNVVQFGADVWGCTAASELYFDKAPRELDLFESTFLVTVLPAPRAGPSGWHAERCRRGQRLLICRLFVSGLAGAEDSAVCCDRVSRLHRLLAEGTPLRPALAAVRDHHAHEHAALFRELADALEILPIRPADLLISHCGDAQEHLVIAKLHARGSAAALARAIATGDLEELRPATSHRS